MADAPRVNSAAGGRRRDRWAAGEATADDVRWLATLLKHELLTNKMAASPRLTELAKEYRQVESELALPRIAPGIADGGPGLDQPVFVRGDCQKPGETVPRRYLEVLANSRAGFTSPASGRLELVSGEHCEALGDSVRFHFSQGHTPGLMLSEIVGAPDASGAGHGGLVFCADLIPGRAWVHVPITMGYDRYPEMLIDEKRAFLEDKLARNVHLYFTHDHDCALAQVTRDAKGKFGTTHEVAALVARSATQRHPAQSRPPDRPCRFFISRHSTRV